MQIYSFLDQRHYYVPLRIAVDFDGTIADTDYPRIRGIRKGAVEALDELHRMGHILHLWTCRGAEALEAAVAFCNSHNIPLQFINVNCPTEIERWGNDSRKIGAEVYIDDRCILGIPPWSEIPNLIKIKAREAAVKTRLIGISGRRGSGKNTVAEVIHHRMPDAWRERSFAAPLKEMAAMITGLPVEMMYTPEGKAHPLEGFNTTVGGLLQKLGTDAIRDNLHPDTWIMTLFNQRQHHENTIITDVRFPNELDAIRKAGGIVLRVEGDPTSVRGNGARNDEHSSETALDDYAFDYLIRNDGTLTELLSKVDGFLKKKVLHTNAILG